MAKKSDPTSAVSCSGPAPDLRSPFPVAPVSFDSYLHVCEQ